MRISVIGAIHQPKIPLPFDNVSRTGLGAYSVYKEIAEYTGSAFRAKRASDGVEQDIGFGPDGWVDMAAYAAFGTGSEKIVKWYDQSGNGFDLSQTDTTKCGTLETSSYSSKPVLHCPSGTKYSNATFTDWNGKAHINFIQVRRLVSNANVQTIGDAIGGMSIYTFPTANYPDLNFRYNENFTTWFGSQNTFQRVNGQNGVVVRHRYDGDGATGALQARLYKNGNEITAATSQSHQTTRQNATGLIFHEGTTEGGNMEYSGFYYIGGTLSDPDWATIDSQLRQRHFDFADSQIQFAGDSLTVANTVTSDQMWRNIVVADLEAATGKQWDAFTGGTTAQEVGAETERVFQLMFSGDGVLQRIDTHRQNKIVVAWAGTNDFANGDTLADAQAGALAIAQEIVAWGGTCYYLNMLPRTDLDATFGAGSNAAFEVKRGQFNSGLATLLSGYATVIDVASITELQDADDTTYFPDHVHLSAAGYALIADKVYERISTDLGI